VIQSTWQNDKTDAGFAQPDRWCQPMRDWIDQLNFCARVALMILVVAITIAVIGWDVIEMPF
jgi:hypothetical protein